MTGYFMELLGRIELFRSMLGEHGSDTQIDHIRISTESWIKLFSDKDCLSHIRFGDESRIFASGRMKIGNYWITRDEYQNTEVVCMELPN